MRFFDAHCDTVMKVFDPDGFDFLHGGPAHVDLPRLEAAGACTQLFAVFTARRRFPDRDLRAYADQALAVIRGWVQGSAGRLRLALTADDIREAGRSNAVYALIGLEGADPLGESADELESFFQAGVRNVIAAWDDNAFSGTVFGGQGPLTPQGFRLVQMCEERGVMVDVSHLSDAAFWQVSRLARRPFVASHSDCRAVCPSSRNLTDDMIRALAASGGVMGINLAPAFLSPDYLSAWEKASGAAWSPVADAADAEAQAAHQRELQRREEAIPRPRPEWIVRHVLHAISVGGEDCVGLGGDLDGISSLPAGMTGVESYVQIPELLARAGLSESQIEKVCWRNFSRVFQQVLPA
jgi:membrane dipeptidase